jgi:small-conductance mechanosensitive channel
MESPESTISFLSHTLVSALLTFLIGLAIAIGLARLAGKLVQRHGTAHLAMIARKGVFYIGLIIVVATTLLALDVNLTAALGAAGILTFAIGFASQTSLSNLISGLFLLGERPFEVGDLIIVGGTRGVVLSIDLLSVKLRTPDNLFVRLPNESIIKNEFTNVTRFPIRRVDVNIGVAYREDPQRVMRVLREVADANPFCLDEPEPLVLFKDFGASSLDFLLGVWVEKTQFLKLKNSIMVDVKARFDAEGIEIPFPHLTLYTGSETTPFPVQLGQPKEEPPPKAD